MMKMSQVREFAFKFLYHINMNILQAIDTSQLDEFVTQTKSEFDDIFIEFDTSYGRDDQEHPDNKVSMEVKSLSKEFITGVLDNFESLIESVNQHVRTGHASKVEKIDLCCLLIGIYELKFKNTPKKVVINEVLTIGQKYGGPKTPSFLNGILDKIKKEA